MRFPNGFKGVSKVFTAEILSLISSVMLIVAGGVSIATLTRPGVTDDAAAATLGIAGILTLIVGIILIIALIIKLVGLAQAGKDEPYFKTAFIIAIVVLVLAVLSSVLTALLGANSVFDDIVSLVQRIGDIVIIFLVIAGIQTFAVRLSNEKIMNKGTSVAWLIAIPYILGAIANLIPALFGTNTATSSISGVMSLISGVLGVIGSIMYLVYLGQGKKMLKEEN